MATINTTTGEVIYPVTIKGNIVADPVIKQVKTKNSAYPVKVANFKILWHPTDEQGNRIPEAKPIGYNVEAWRDQATNASLTMKQGDFVSVTGYLTKEKFTGSDDLEHVANKLKNATCTLLAKKKAVAEPAPQAVAQPARVRRVGRKSAKELWQNEAK